MSNDAAMDSDRQGEAPQSFWNMAGWCCFYGSGIIGLLVVYGVLQERIMTIPYDGAQFTTSVFLVFCNRMAAVVFAIGLAIYHKEDVQNKAPIWKYLIISLSSVYASSCQYECLRYVSFAVQMLGKSFKMMPVMVWGMAINGKRYSMVDWAIAGAVTLGVTEFLMTGPTESSSGTGNSMRGFLFLGAFLVLDGLTSTMQEKLFKEHKVSKYNQMMWVNLLSACVSLITLLASNSFVSSLKFWVSHPAFMLDAAVLSASAATSQWFIYSQVKEFGALAFAATMNVRQMVSIIVSYLKFGHFISPWQVLGLAAVFGALFYKSYKGFMEARDGVMEPLVKKDDAPPEAAKGVADKA